MSGLAERIQKRLDATNMNATSAAVAAGLGKDYIRDVLRGQKKTINNQAAISLCRVLHCNLEWLLNGDGDETPDEPPSEDTQEAAPEDAAPSIKFGGNGRTPGIALV
jgi:transcriptional regulator with XRE-family HTH domain